MVTDIKGRFGAVGAVLVVGLLAGGCAGGLGALGDILTAPGPEGQAGVATVEIQEVRQARQEVIVRTQEGRQGPILYDQNTQVIYQNQQYPITALERGDIVDARVHQVERGYYTDLIQVRTPVQERTGGTTPAPQPDIFRIEGTLGDIDAGAGTFALNMTQGGTVIVVVPAGATAARDRLRDHQPGDYVRVEVRPIDQQRAELVRFGWS